MDQLGRASDQELAVLASAGRHDAWSLLVARHQHRVLLSLLARGVRLDVAKEIVQETWTRLYAKQRAERLPRLELPGLAIRQAAFLAMDRARAPAQKALPATAAYRTADPAPLADERMATREQIERAVEELDKCPPRAREIFLLVYRHPHSSHAELAKIAGISVQRLRQTLCEVRARLRRAIEASEKEGGHDAS